MQEQGLAWISSYAGSGAGVVAAFLEIEYSPSRIHHVTEDLAKDPEVLTIDLTAGGRDMIVTLICRDHAAVALVLDRLSTVQGIRNMRTQRSIQLVADAHVWRLLSINAGEVRELERALPPPKKVLSNVPPDIEEGLGRILRADARALMSRISSELGISQARARSALHTVLAQQRTIIRLEVARPIQAGRSTSGSLCASWRSRSVQ